MDSMVSKAQATLSEETDNKVSRVKEYPEDSTKASETESTSQDLITTQLYLKPSSNSSSKALDKDVVLRRIRHHKNLNKFRSAFQAFFNNSEQVHEELLKQNDVFSSP